MKIKHIEHVSLHVKDVEASTDFYARTLKLERLPRPAMSIAGAWFRLGERQQLHLIGERNEPVHSAIRGNHFAVGVDDLSAFEAHFRDSGVEFFGPMTLPDGMLRLFLRDLDGHMLELVSASA
jgi:Glyoxalase/Bleomycin resistance protein/Dioxygenase superfamily.